MARRWPVACFFSPDCPHCHEAIAFLNQRRGIAYVLHDISKPSSEALFQKVVKRYGIEDPAVPLIVRGSRYIIGFDSAEKRGREILALLSVRMPSRNALHYACIGLYVVFF
ncbi:glutaredoxin family protein [Methylocystis sp.]|uniref:glutaredoxin family protein n=1 Tax=Methylocystis sp. TaxID=1911079 RepID=UPI003D0F306A